MIQNNKKNNVYLTTETKLIYRLRFKTLVLYVTELENSEISKIF